MIGLLVVCLSLVGLSYIVDLSYSFRDLFTLLFKIYNKYIKMYLQHSASVSSSCIVAWLWPEFRLETICHINKTIYKWVGCDCEYL